MKKTFKIEIEYNPEKINIPGVISQFKDEIEYIQDFLKDKEAIKINIEEVN